MAAIDTDLDVYEDEMADDGFLAYRALSKAAVMSLLLAFLSLLALVFPTMLVLPIVGVIFGFVALKNLRRYPDELTGRIPAIIGTFGCLAVLVGGASWHTHAYLTEVPDGYTRISYSQLQPEGMIPGTNTPQLPMELDGKRIFIKGYVHPGVSSMGRIRKFILVPDMGTCCFGGQPKRMTDMIEVTLTTSKGIQYSLRKRKVGGILHVRYQVHKVAGGLDGGLYELKADYVK